MIKITKDKLDVYLSDLYDEAVKLNKNSQLLVDIFIMGGTAVMINNKFRETTIDIDAYIRSTIDLKRPIQMVAANNGLPEDWLNSNVTATQSFSKQLLHYFKLYKCVENKFVVYVINSLAQVCMKLVAFRVDSSDVTDIVGIIEEGFEYSYDDVMEAITDIYGDDSVLSVDAQLFIYNLLNKVMSTDEKFDVAATASDSVLMADALLPKKGL